MKSAALFLIAAALAAPALPAAQAGPKPGLAHVQRVYLLPMASGFDQYLANRLTSAGVFQVVTDPATADAVFTDQLGEAFTTRLDELCPAPEPAAEQPAKPQGEGQPAAKAEPAAPQPPETNSTPAPDSERRKPAFAATRARGNVFLVDVRTRAVVWSTYDRPRSSRPDELNRAASGVVRRLQHDLKRK